MPFTLLVVGAAVAVSYLRGGRLQHAAHADLQGSWMLFTGLAIQLLVDLAAGRDLLAGAASYVPLLVSQVLVLAWIARNWSRPGMGLVFLGFLCNAVVIAANGAMPVDPDAIRAIGLEGARVPPGKHVLMGPDTHLDWLADRYPLAPIRTIISIGDILLAAGLIPLVHHLLTYRPAPQRRGGARSAGGGTAAAEATDEARTGGSTPPGGRRH